MGPKKIPEADLLKKYLNGTITAPESEVLFTYLRENSIENDPDTEALLKSSYEESFAEPPALSDDAGRRILNRLLASAQQGEVTEVMDMYPQRSGWWKYAAAAMLIGITAAVLFWFNHQKRNISQAEFSKQAAAIGPGSDRAALKLGNGQVLVLDSSRGAIAQIGQLTVYNYGGKLGYKGKADVPEYQTLSTPRGGQFKTQLTDGTDVWLNAESSISYPTAFTGDQRKVKITGEVYFEVAKLKEKPFIVDMNGKGIVEVLGTHFNINAYEDEKNAQATLLEGSVRVSQHRQMVMLKPGQQAQVGKLEIDVINNPDIEMVMAWRNGFFHFNHAPVDEVLRQLARWYDVDVTYEQSIPDIKFSGEIKKDLDLSQALIVLNKMGVHFRLEGKKLIVMP